VPVSAEDLRVLVTLLRRLRGPWTQAEMAVKAGINRGSISQYESGELRPSRAAIEKLAGAAGVPPWVVDGLLLPVIELSREIALDPGRAATDAPLEVQRAGDEPASPAVRLGVARFLAAPALASGEESDAKADAELSASADDPWTLLPAAAQGALPSSVALHADFERLVERACAESERAAAHDASRALELARLALQVAELAPGEPSWRAGLIGYAQVFVANALRAADDLRAADEALAAAWTLWRLVDHPGEAILCEWRLLDLEASLRRDQRRFGAALDLLDRALASAPLGTQGRILLKKAFTLEQAGESEGALVVLAEAAPLVDAGDEPRDRLGVRFNTVVNLVHLGRLREAEASLAELRQLVSALGNDLDATRLRWLASRIAAGLGRRQEALDGLVAVQRDFRERGKAYDAGLASLDLAVLYLDEGRTRDVARLAGEMAWIFSRRDVHRETLAALQLFREAAERETLTAELVRRLRDGLERPWEAPCRLRHPRRPRGRPRRRRISPVQGSG
jgi:transcriptional regulator with XRE-family HTH domain